MKTWTKVPIVMVVVAVPAFLAEPIKLAARLGRVLDDKRG
jgi:hypothetical protein